MALAIGLGILLVGSLRQAIAQGSFTLFNDLGAGGTFHATYNTPVVNYIDENDLLNYSTIAMQISVPIGTNVTLSSFQIGVGADSGAGDLILSITTDNNGAPGTVLDSYERTIGTRALYSFVSTNSPMLSGGNYYWVVASAGTNSQLAWYLDPNAGFGSSASSDDGTNWSPGNSSYALRVNAEITSVPEPVAMWLASLGLVGLFALRRRI